MTGKRICFEETLRGLLFFALPNLPTMIVSMTMTMTMTMILTLILIVDVSGMPSPPGAGRLSPPAPQQQRICFKGKAGAFSNRQSPLDKQKQRCHN